MSLTVWCVSGDPPHRVAAMLSQLRQVADEMIIAVDARVDPDTLGPLEDLVDRIFRVEVQPPMERVLPWLHRHCSGDWTLRVDSDEVPSPALVRELPDLSTATDVLQYHLPRRWLFPDTSHWLDEWPWAPDYQNRLLRNDPTVWFPGLSQTSAAEAFPARYLELPIYHLVTAVTEHAQRAERVRYYQGIDASLRELRGDALLPNFYLPEEHANLDPVEVPADDKDAIQEVLSTQPHPKRRFTNVPAVVPSLEVDHFWPARPIAETAYRAHIEPLFAERSMPARETHSYMRLLVHNLGDHWWPGGERLPLIRVAYRWLALDGSAVVSEGYRSSFPAPVPPGASCVTPVVVVSPSKPGTYVLEFDVVHEFVRWFGSTTQVEMTIDHHESMPRWKVPEAQSDIVQDVSAESQ